MRGPEQNIASEEVPARLLLTTNNKSTDNNNNHVDAGEKKAAGEEKKGRDGGRNWYIKYRHLNHNSH